MTESAWLACTDPHPMLMFLTGRVSDRKLRLFACGCCRRIWHLLTDEQSRKAVEVAERYAEGDLNDDDLNTACAAVGAASMYSLGCPAAAAEAAAEATWGHDAFGGPYHASLLTYNVSYAVGEAVSESIAQCDLLRDVNGNPFRPVAIAPSWLTPPVVAIARAAYEERALPRGELDLARLAILADALLDAGCPTQTILDHLRSPGPHVRGCWAVDLILDTSSN